MSEIRDFIVHRSEFNQAESWYQRTHAGKPWLEGRQGNTLDTSLALTFVPEEGDLVPEDMGRVYLVFTLNYVRDKNTGTIVETFPIFPEEGKSLETVISEARWEVNAYRRGFKTAFSI